VREPKGIYYTPTTGIWQTVWIEPVGATHRERLSIRPGFDGSTVEVMATGPGTGGPSRFEFEVLDGDRVVARGVTDRITSTRSLPPRKIDEEVLRTARAQLYAPPPAGHAVPPVPAADKGPKAE
jgi:hypothetical protein